MSMNKYRVKEVAADFGMSPKEISDIVGNYYEKPKSYTQVLTPEELNALFDHVTRHNQISSLEAVFAVKPKEQPAPAAKAEQPKAEGQPNRPQQQNRPTQQGQRPGQQGQPNRPQQGQQNRPAQQGNRPMQNNQPA